MLQEESRNNFKQELELKNVLACDLKQQVASFKQREAHYIDVINTLQANEDEQYNKLLDRVKALEQDCINIKADFYLETTNCDEEITKLENELNILTTNNDKGDDINDTCNASNETLDENLVLQEDIHTLNDELLEKQMELGTLQRHYLKLSEVVKISQVELDQLNENIDGKIQSITETNSVIRTVEEEMLKLHQELHAIKQSRNSQDVGENSLFAEVNKKRLELQEVLLEINKKCDKIKLEISGKQKQICAARLWNDELTKIVKEEEIEYKAGPKQQIDTYNTQIVTLEKLSEKYEMMKMEIKQLKSRGLPNNVVKFLNDLGEEQKRNEEELNEEIGMEFRLQKIMAVQLNEAYLKLQECKDTTEKLKNKCLKQKEDLIELNQNNPNLGIGNESTPELDIETNGLVLYNENYKNVKMDNVTKRVAYNITDKKVHFATGTKVTDNHLVRKGGKVLKSKPIFIPKLIKK